MSVFFSILFMVFVAELGDKSMLLMIAMASKYKVRDVIFGVGIAILVLNAIAIAVGTLIGEAISPEAINIIAGLAFLYFAFSAFGKKDDEKEETVKSVTKFGAILTIFGMFFIAELGDNTQLTALTVAAENGIDKMLYVFLGASIGLFAADVIGFLLGFFLGKSVPSWIFNWISFAIFALFGMTRVYEGFEKIFNGNKNGMLFSIISTSLIMLAFVSACALKPILQKRKKVKNNENEKENQSV